MKRGPGRAWIVPAAVGFVAGAIGVALMVWNLPDLMRSNDASGQHPEVLRLVAGRDVAAASNDPVQPALKSRPRVVETLPLIGTARIPFSTAPDFEADPLVELRDRQLTVPVRGVTRQELRDSFTERRGSTHSHEAMDILAPRNTEVLAVEDGVVARLFESKPGGTTVYQFDPTARYAYYYAHLEKYADGLHEGNDVRRGQVLGYVGTSGNAPKDTPHLHFAIFRLTDKKQWWRGSPIDPYDVLK